MSLFYNLLDIVILQRWKLESLFEKKRMKSFEIGDDSYDKYPQITILTPKQIIILNLDPPPPPRSY